MTHSTGNNWSSAPPDYDIPGTVHEKKKRPNKEFIRQLSVAVGDEPSFYCPACHGRWKLSYGVFGKIPLHRIYGESQFWCRECAELNQISRTR